MIVALRAVELLCLFAVAGAPPPLWPLERQESHILQASRLLLAPLAGVAALAVLGSAAYAARQPINLVVIPFWCLVAVAWIALVVRRVHRGRPIGLLEAARAVRPVGGLYALIGVVVV